MNEDVESMTLQASCKRTHDIQEPKESSTGRFSRPIHLRNILAGQPQVTQESKSHNAPSADRAEQYQELSGEKGKHITRAQCTNFFKTANVQMIREQLQLTGMPCDLALQPMRNHQGRVRITLRWKALSFTITS